MTFQLQWLNRVPKDEGKTSADIQKETGKGTDTGDEHKQNEEERNKWN